MACANSDHQTGVSHSKSGENGRSQTQKNKIEKERLVTMLLSRLPALARTPLLTRTNISVPSGATVQKAFQDAVKPGPSNDKKVDTKEKKVEPEQVLFFRMT
jgi:hypothetical protein